jgi:uncharacterized protein
VIFVVVVPLVWLLYRRLGHDGPRDLGLVRPIGALIGALVVAGSAMLVFGADAALGGTRIESIDAFAFGRFLMINAAIALALEALPEELALRGYTFHALRLRWRTVPAAVLTTALFVLAPGLSSVIAWALTIPIGQPVAPSFAPGGQEPWAYLLLLAVFGAMLVTARVATGSLWACVAAHLMFLTINRGLLASDQFDAGLTVQMKPGGEILVLVYLVLATLAFWLLGRRRQRASGASRATAHGIRAATGPSPGLSDSGPAGQPPAIAPTTMNGSSPWATRSGSGASGSSWERSSSQA